MTVLFLLVAFSLSFAVGYICGGLNHYNDLMNELLEIKKDEE